MAGCDDVWCDGINTARVRKTVLQKEPNCEAKTAADEGLEASNVVTTHKVVAWW